MTNTNTNPGLLAARRIKDQRKRLRAELAMLEDDQARACVADVIELTPDWFESIDINDALRYAPRVGAGTVLWMLSAAGIEGQIRLCQLTADQRGVLAELLRAGESEWRQLRVA